MVSSRILRRSSREKGKGIMNQIEKGLDEKQVIAELELNCLI
jgi:hypothetical protein